MDGPFRVSDHVADLERVLDALGWDRAVVLGHSWGGHLALHAALELSERVAGVLAVDTLGAVADGGMGEFGGALTARTSPASLRRIAEIDALDEQGTATDADVLERLHLMWPAYFPTPEAAPPPPEVRIGRPCSDGTMASVMEELPRLEASLPSISMPVGFLVGAASPMPASASTDAAQRIKGAWVESVPAAAHFTWLDVPGSVRKALDRLTLATETGS